MVMTTTRCPMVRSSTLLTDKDPIVSGIVHVDNVCTVGVTNFVVNINPAGMALIKSIDPEAIFIERFYHQPWAKSAMHWANVTSDQLCGLSGFSKLFTWCVNETKNHQVWVPNTFVNIMIVTGFPYEIDVKESSPLVRWFHVLKGVSN